MAWVVLFVAGVLEIGWAVGLEYTEGFTRPWSTVGTAVALIASMVLLGVAVRTLPLGTACAVRTGIGTAGTAVLGIVPFREPAVAMRLACIALIVAGIVGLKLATPSSPYDDGRGACRAPPQGGILGIGRVKQAVLEADGQISVVTREDGTASSR